MLGRVSWIHPTRRLPDRLLTSPELIRSHSCGHGRSFMGADLVLSTVLFTKGSDALLAGKEILSVFSSSFVGTVIPLLVLPLCVARNSTSTAGTSSTSSVMIIRLGYLCSLVFHLLASTLSGIRGSRCVFLVRQSPSLLAAIVGTLIHLLQLIFSTADCGSLLVLSRCPV